ncbi:MAG: DUF4214 domain-containing protein, partial [Ruminococcus sp.]|nr:DUF4214 domain-containing protein [Ruminococcus sp.]
DDMGAFEGCTSLSEVIFTPGGTESATIGKEAFRGIPVETLTIPANYTNIKAGAFRDCKKLTIVNFEDGSNKASLGADIFNNCTSLRHAILSRNISYVGSNAFYNCNNAVVVRHRNNFSFENNTFSGAKAVVQYDISNGTASITNGTTNAEKVHIPCRISGYGTSTQIPNDFPAIGVVDHLYYGNTCYLCGKTIRPKPTATPGSEKITLSWDTINSASKYAIYNYYNGTFDPVAEITETTYTLTNLRAGETYGFALSAFNNGKWTELNPEDVVYATPEGSAINAFVDRLYTIILGRGAEPAGLADWTNRLTSETATSAEIVYGIAGSKEFQEKNYANDVIVEKMYNAMLGRGSDPAGKENWVKQLNAGMSFNAIINGFSGSQEFAQVCTGYGILPGNISQIEPRDVNAGLTAFVSRMYTKALGRGYDVNGLNDWTGSYLNGTATTADIAYGFIFSKEFTEKNYTDEQYVDILYSTFFDRAPDEGGKQNWLNDLADGKSREHVLNGFLGSKEFLDLAASFGV